MSKKRLSSKDYARYMRDIKSFVNFNYKGDLSKYQKAKIKKYHSEIEGLRARPNYVYRPRKKENLKKAQTFSQHEMNLPGLKVAFIPTAVIDDKPKIRFNRKGQISVASKYVQSYLIELNRKKLAKGGEEYINKVLDENPQYKYYTISAGKFEIPSAESRYSLPGKIRFLMEKYDGEKNDEGKLMSDWRKWLTSIRGYKFTNQRSAAAYLTSKQKAKQKLQRENRNKRNREKYAANKAKK